MSTVSSRAEASLSTASAGSPALSKTFRRIFLKRLGAAFRRGELGFFGDLARLTEPGAFAERVRALRQSSFVVYAKPPFGGPERVLAYLARYTHRTAIANSRLLAVDDDEVAFSYRDYRRDGRSRVMRLAPPSPNANVPSARQSFTLKTNPLARFPHSGQPARAFVQSGSHGGVWVKRIGFSGASVKLQQLFRIQGLSPLP